MRALAAGDSSSGTDESDDGDEGEKDGDPKQESKEDEAEEEDEEDEEDEDEQGATGESVDEDESSGTDDEENGGSGQQPVEESLEERASRPAPAAAAPSDPRIRLITRSDLLRLFVTLCPPTYRAFGVARTLRAPAPLVTARPLTCELRELSLRWARTRPLRQ